MAFVLEVSLQIQKRGTKLQPLRPEPQLKLQALFEYGESVL